MSRRLRKVSLPGVGIATKERLNQAGPDRVAKINMDPQKRSRHDTVRVLDPVDYLRSHNLLTPTELNAADRIVEDHIMTLMGAQMGMDPSKPIVDHSPVFQVPVERLDAAQRLALAFKAVGDIHAHPIRRILLEGSELAAYGEYMGRYSTRRDRTTAALTSLRNALNALAKYYGLAEFR